MSSNTQSGFTLVELVMMIIILGILAASAIPKFFSVSAYQQRGFFDDTLSALRYAQKLAVASGCNVRFAIAGNAFALSRPSASDRSLCNSTTAADFTQAVARPGSGETSYQGSQSGMSVTTATLYFTAKGTASANATINVGSNQISVVQDTGFVYDSTP